MVKIDTLNELDEKTTVIYIFAIEDISQQVD
jgi:hypothetical protein